MLAGAGLSVYQFYEFKTVEMVKMNEEIASLNSNIEKKEAELRRVQNFKENIEKVKQELRELNLDLEGALEHMPRSFNLFRLLKRFSELAQNSGLELWTFKPKKGEERKEGAFYSAITIDFELQGAYPQTLKFLDDISRLKRIVNVEDIKVKTIDGTQQRQGAMVAQTLASVKTYRFAE